MARLCKMNKHKRQKELVKKYGPARKQLRAIINDPNVSFDEKILAQKKMQALPRDSSASRIRNRCLVTGRSRGVYRKVNLARTKFREYFNLGLLPGFVKASW